MSTLGWVGSRQKIWTHIHLRIISNNLESVFAEGFEGLRGIEGGGV